jgi:5-(carboxyamino)imidazole ribonucleotide synthase
VSDQAEVAAVPSPRATGAPRRTVPVVGMIGAGQLARMTSQAATGLGIGFRVLAASPADSAALVCRGTQVGDYRSADDLAAFAAGCDVVTFDHEQVPAAALAGLTRSAAAIRPGPAALRLTQDKRAMREWLTAHGVACPQYAEVAVAADVETFAGRHGWPVVLKAVSGGYDGRGVWVCGDAGEAAGVLAGAAARGIALLAEQHVAFERELAALVARSPARQGASYAVVQTVQQDGICREVELFETADGLLVNELAMRPHNSGHWTIDGSRTSQFEQHLRAVLNLPMGDPRPTAAAVVMVNVLGGDDDDLHDRLIHVWAADPGVKVHLYGKEVQLGRKVGHVTVAGGDMTALRDRARRAANYLSLGTEEP